MKKSMVKRLGCLLLAAAMILPAAGCGKDSKKGASTKMDKDHVYSYVDVPMEETFDSIGNITHCNDRIYAIGMKYNTSSSNYLISFKPDGTDVKIVPLLTGMEVENPTLDGTGEPEADTGNADTGEIVQPRSEENDASQDNEEDTGEEATGEEDTTEEDTSDDTAEASEEGTEKIARSNRAVVSGSTGPMTGTTEIATVPDTGIAEEAYEFFNIWMNGFVLDKEGNVYSMVQTSKEKRDEAGNFTSEYENYFIGWKNTGELSFSKNVKESGIQDPESFYTQGMFCDADNNIMIYGNMQMYIFDNQGNMTKSGKLGENDNGSIFTDRKGNLFMVGWNSEYTKQNYRMLDKNTLTFGEPVEFNAAMSNLSMSQDGTKYDLLLSSNTGLFGYNLGDAEPVEIMDYIDSDLLSYGLQGITSIGENKFIAAYNDIIDYSYRLAIFSKVDPADVVDKEGITLACYYLNTDMKKRVVDFNKTNTKYRINVNDYSQYATSEDYMAGYTQLNNDILSGKVPDIMLVDDSMPIDSFIAKGLFEDLYPYIEKDPDMNKEDFLTNILDAYSHEGKLYRIVPSFNVFTVMGKTSKVGAERGWTLEDLNNLMAQQPEGTQVFSEMNRAGVLNYAIMMSKADFIDSETGNCSFDSKGFIDLLEFIKQFPEEFDYGTSDGMDWESMQATYREDKTLLMGTFLSRFADFNRYEKGTFGEEVTLIGFPSESKNGNAIMADIALAISSKSAQKEGAWEFIRYYLTDDYQNQITYSFPIKKTALDKLGAEAMERPFYLNDDGTKEYYDDSIYLNGVDVKLDPMTQAEVDEFKEFLLSLTTVGSYDNSLINIINEETAPFFAGQKSAEEVAKIIQSRVQIYINENR